MNEKILVVYTSPKLGDAISQLTFIRAISDHYKSPVSIAINTNMKLANSFTNVDYVNFAISNGFRKGFKFFFKDLFSFVSELKKKNFHTMYVLDKTKLPVIAARLAGIKNIIGPGIGSQKYFLTNKAYLNKSDLKLSYPFQSLKFLKINNITVNHRSPKLNIDFEKREKIKKEFQKFPRPWVAMGIDSSEDNRIWSPNNFFKLAKKLKEKKIGSTFFLICHIGKQHLADEILKNDNSFNDNFIDCRSMNILKIIDIISSVDFFVGIDSGPSCLAAAFDINTFCLIGPTDASALWYDRLVKIKSENYNNKREIGILRHGDNFDQSDEEVNSIDVKTVLDKIVEFSN